jgi:hypothetical protein
MLTGMSHLRLVPPVEDVAPDAAGDAGPRVSLRLLMAMSGRCSCDACLLAYRGGDKSAGIIPVPPVRRLRAVR